MKKHHYVVPHGDIHVPLCGQHDYSRTLRTRMRADVTCKRCLRLLDVLDEADRTVHPYTVLLQYLDGAPLEQCTPPTYVEWVETATVSEAIAAAKAQCCRAMGYDDGDPDGAGFRINLFPLRVFAGHHHRLAIGQ